MSNLTQADVNEAFDGIKTAWDKAVLDSGKSEQMFIALDDTGFVSDFMYKYQAAKECVEGEGLVMPKLIKGLKVKIS